MITSTNIKLENGIQLMPLDEIYKKIVDGSAFNELITNMTYEIINNNAGGLYTRIYINRLTGIASYTKDDDRYFLATDFRFHYQRYQKSQLIIYLNKIINLTQHNEDVPNPLIKDFQSSLLMKLKKLFKPIMRDYMDKAILNELQGEMLCLVWYRLPIYLTQNIKRLHR